MRLAVAGLPDRILASLYGASAAEGATGTPAGVRQLLDFVELLAEAADLDEERLRRRQLDTLPATGCAGLLLRAVPIALLTPLDRPRVRRYAHRATLLGRGDEGTAMVAVATACLAADLCRFDLDTALVRLRQTLIEEAPTALLARLGPTAEPLPWASGDPGDALQLAITALDRADDVPAVVADVSGYGGDVAAAAALAASLAGARSGLQAIDEGWLATVPARPRIEAAAAALAARAVALLPAS